MFVFFIILAIVCSANGSEVFDSGKAYLNNTLPNDPGCTDVLFVSRFQPNQDIRVITSLSHSDLLRSVHDPAALWVKQVTSRGFRVCVRESGVGSNGTGVVNWIAAQGTFDGYQHGSITFDQWGSGTQCKTVRPQKLYLKRPQVFATVEAPDSSTRQDAMNVWVTKHKIGEAFSVCLREMVNFDGVHRRLKVNWIAYQELPFSMNVTESNKVTIDTSSASIQQIDYTFCKNVNFKNEFISPPVVVTTASYYSNDSTPVAQECKAMSVWIEEITKTYFRICTRELKNGRSKTSIINLDYIVQEDLDPCINVSCNYFSVCKAFAPKDARCVCVDDCPSYEEQVCSSNGTTFKNKCFFGLEMCRLKSNHTLYHPGSCTVLDIDECTTDSPCHVNATCINIPGSYVCRCNNGFSGDGFSCNDIDECATNTHHCDRNAYCNNTEGLYHCTCRKGYYGNGTKCTTSRGIESSAILNNYGNADYLRTLVTCILFYRVQAEVIGSDVGGLQQMVGM